MTWCRFNATTNMSSFSQANHLEDQTWYQDVVQTDRILFFKLQIICNVPVIQRKQQYNHAT